MLGLESQIEIEINPRLRPLGVEGLMNDLKSMY